MSASGNCKLLHPQKATVLLFLSFLTVKCTDRDLEKDTDPLRQPVKDENTHTTVIGLLVVAVEALIATSVPTDTDRRNVILHTALRGITTIITIRAVDAMIIRATREAGTVIHPLAVIAKMQHLIQVLQKQKLK